MATNVVGTDLRVLKSKGEVPDLPQYLSDDDAMKAYRTKAQIAVLHVSPAEPKAQYKYWTFRLLINGKGPFLWSAPYNEMRDTLAEWMDINEESAPFTGLRFANLDRDDKAPWLYLMVAD